jgi:hypothetical protein
VAFVRFESAGIEAASLFEPGACPVILVNRRNPRSSYMPARRSTLIHHSLAAADFQKALSDRIV